MSYISINRNASYADSMRYIKKLATDGAQNEQIKQFAKEALNSSNPLEKVFNIAYDSAVYVPNPDEEQNLQPVYVTLREKIANCVNYSVLIGAILTAMNYPYQFKLVDFTHNFEGYKHIYVVSKGKILDCVIGQDIEGNETFETRNSTGKYNIEVPHTFSKIYNMPALNILQGVQKVKPLILVNASRGRAGRIGFRSAHEKSINWWGSDVISSIDKGLASIDPTNAQTGVGGLVSKVGNTIESGLAQLDPFNPAGSLNQTLASFDPFNAGSGANQLLNTATGLIGQVVGGVTGTKKPVLSTTQTNQAGLGIIPIIAIIGGAGLITYILSSKDSKQRRK
jgi:hypothetical protein